MFIESLIKVLLFQLPPETAHRVAMRFLSSLDRLLPENAPLEADIEVFGVKFSNRIGLAAGYDKNAEYLRPLSRLGFGFIEVGTVTPRPQPGRDLPRVFRIPERKALINRMGFPSVGLERFVKNLESSNYTGTLGVNIGKNADTPVDAAATDYLTCLRAVAPLLTM